MRWSDLTWPEIPDVLARCGQAAILPVGATEQHGPHLGCGVDFVIAEQLCAAVAAQTGVPMLPTLPYGCSLGHSRRWPGTLALQPVTLIQLVKEIGDWAYHSGIRRLFIVNAHVTNAAPLRCALEMLRAEHDDLMVAVINTGTGRNSATTDKFPNNILPRTFDYGAKLAISFKDISLCLDEAERRGVPMWLAPVVKQVIGFAIGQDGDAVDVTTLVKHYERWCGIEIAGAAARGRSPQR